MNTKKRIGLLTFIIVACLMACNTNNNNKKETEKAAVSGRHAELKLPDGFSATIVADSLGPLRHLVIATNGDVYTNFKIGRASCRERVKILGRVRRHKNISMVKRA